jgi:hypothetical protein
MEAAAGQDVNSGIFASSYSSRAVNGHGRHDQHVRQ